MKLQLVLLAGILCGSSLPLHASGRETPGEFDYWVLALSWSPEYCRRNLTDEQCREPHGFIVHGLWPQYEKGYPDFCKTLSTHVPDALEARMLRTMPSRKLVRHQWKKHGSCSGLDVTEYFQEMERAAGRIAIPLDYTSPEAHLPSTLKAIEQAFGAVNPELDPDEIAVRCSGRYLREVHICLDRDFSPRSCGADVRDSCRKPEVILRPVPTP